MDGRPCSVRSLTLISPRERAVGVASLMEISMKQFFIHDASVVNRKIAEARYSYSTEQHFIDDEIIIQIDKRAHSFGNDKARCWVKKPGFKSFGAQG